MGVKVATNIEVVLAQDPSYSDVKLALVSFNMPAFASTDTGSAAVAVAIQNARRAGKTVTLLGACQGAEANGHVASTNADTTYRTGTLAVSGALITFHMTDTAGADADSPATHTQSVGANPGDRPFQIAVAYTEA